MKRVLTVLLLLFIANSLAAQRKSANKVQSFLSIETGVPIVVPSFQTFPIPLTIEYQWQKKRWGLGAGLGLTYDRNSSGDCSKRTITKGQDLGFYGPYPYPYFPYCATSQYLNLKPSIFGSYYFLQKRKMQLFAKLGGVADVPIFKDIRGEYYQIEVITDIGTTIKVIDAGPIYLHNYDSYYQKPLTRIGLLYGIGGQYALNKKMAVRFSCQSEWYSDYFENNRGGSSLLSALGGLMIKI
jgi:hypothetical protein